MKKHFLAAALLALFAAAAFAGEKQMDETARLKDSGSMIDRIESRQGLHTLDSAEKIGLGKRSYRVVEIK